MSIFYIVDRMDESWRSRRRRDQTGGMAVARLLGTIFAMQLLRRSLRWRRLLVETGCCGLGHDLLREGGFSELSPRIVASLNDRVSGLTQQVMGRYSVGREVGRGA